MPALISSLDNQSSTGTILFFEMSKAVLQNATGNKLEEKNSQLCLLASWLLKRNLHFR